MATNASDPSESKKTAQPSDNFEQLLKKEDEELKKLDEEIKEAEKKSKAVLCDPGP
jgi:flagellar hook-basal body complex protein FliE